MYDYIIIPLLIYLPYFLPLFLVDLSFLLLQKMKKLSVRSSYLNLLFYIIPFGTWVITKSLGVGPQSFGNAFYEPLCLSLGMVLMRLLSLMPVLNKYRKYITPTILLIGIISAVLIAQFFPAFPE